MANTKKQKIIIVTMCTMAAFVAMFAIFSGIYALKTKEELEKVIEPMIAETSYNGWEMQTFEAFISPKLSNWFDNNGSDSMENFKQFGKLKQFYGIDSMKADDKEAKLIAIAEFDIGNAYINMVLGKYEGEWLIDSIHLSEITK